MTFNCITKNGVTITRIRYWSRDTVRTVCINNGMFTRGTNCEYEQMLNKVESREPTTKALFEVAQVILMSSEGRSLAEIMTLLEQAVITTFTVE